MFYGCDDEEAEKAKKQVQKTKKKGEKLLAEDLKKCSGGKLTHYLRYIDEILKPHVEPHHHFCRERDGEFILQEDNDTSHGTASTENPVRVYKRGIDLHYYANPPSSPDFNSIENVWRIAEAES